MHKKEYSAGAVKLSFWFTEFRKVVSLIHSGKTRDEIKLLAENENIFSASSPLRSKQIYNTVSSRVFSLSDGFHTLFEDSDHDMQKLIALIGVMKTDSLFFDFMNDIYREKLIIGDMILTDADIRMFFVNKQRENDKVAKWKDETLTRLRGCYKTYLAEAGLMEHGIGDRKIIKPLLEVRLTDLLSDGGLHQLLKIFTGTR